MIRNSDPEMFMAVWQLFFLIIAHFRKLVLWGMQHEVSQQREFDGWVSVISSFSKVKVQPFGSTKPKVSKCLEGPYKVKPFLQCRVSAHWNNPSQVRSALKHHKYYKQQQFFSIHVTNSSLVLVIIFLSHISVSARNRSRQLTTKPIQMFHVSAPLKPSCLARLS